MSLNTKQTVLIGVAALASTAAAWWLYKSILDLGIDGTFRLLWEGDPYPPEIRIALTKLDKVEEDSIEYEELLNTLEESLARARLDTVDDAITSMIVPLWIVAHAPSDLEKDLAKLNHELDTLAANVDAIPSHGHVDIKLRKKATSNQVVVMMTRADVLLELYQNDNDNIK